MKRRHSPSPPRGSCTASKTRAAVVPQAIRHNDAESVSPPCLRQTYTNPSPTLTVPSVAARRSDSNQNIDGAAPREDLQAPAASARSQRNTLQYKCHKLETAVTLNQEYTRKRAHAQGSAKALLAEAERGESLGTQEKPPCCSQEALLPGEIDERWAAASMVESDIRELSECERGAQWLTQQQAVEEFCLPLQTLKDAANDGLVKVEKRPNPYGATYAPMRLYQSCELRRLAIQIWGGEAGVEKERERRREQRWQQRQQRMSSVLCDSVTLGAGRFEGRARSGRSLPDLRTLLRSASKKKGAGAHRTSGASLRCTSAELSATRAATALPFAAPKHPTAACDSTHKAKDRRTRANYAHAPDSVREHTQSTCAQDIWEEI